MMEQYQELANGIIVQAVKDWRRAIRRRSTIYGRALAEEIEDFFLSEWFSVLTNLDGTWLLKKLREEAGIT